VTISVRRLVRAFRHDLKLRKKLLISYLAIIIIPFAVLALFVSGKIVGIIEQRITYSAEQAFQQAGAFLEYKLYNVRRISHIILVDPEVNAILLKESASNDLRAQRIDMEQLTNYFFPLQDGVNIARVRLYVRDELEYARENVNIFPLGDARTSLWYRRLEETGNSYLWCPSAYLTADGDGGTDTLSLARFMVDLNDLKRRIGALRIDFDRPQVVDVLRKSSVVRDSCTVVRNGKGDVVAVSDAALLSRFGSFIPAADESPAEREGLVRVRASAGEALVGIRELEGTDWRMTTIIPFAGIVAESRRIRNQIFLIIIAVAAAVTLLAYFISGSVTHRLSWIIETMEDARGGSLEKLHLPAGNDEVGELATTYNLMIDEITDLIAREERTQRELKGAELKALQAQINPHFLYNTLDMIKWMSRKGMTDEIEDLLNSLATFYRLSLSEGRETIPIRDELRHVELYARIQSMRFLGAIGFSVDVDERILGCGILKVTLQPLVENSILHGIIEKPTKRGRVSVTGTLADGDVSLVVEDDGVGMDDGGLAAILDPSRARLSGFGVRNIHERFRLFYGEGYGLSYESAPGAGTRVTIRFTATPLVQESRHV
jgi:two-component system sensor histidine kinase YesM